MRLGASEEYMKNQYGLDIDYFEEKIGQLLRDHANYRPDEMARALARLAVVADETVLLEKEFADAFTPLVAKELIRRLREAERDATRYRWLRERDIETIDNGGIFAGSTPDNFVLNGEDLDDAIDEAMDQSNG